MKLSKKIILKSLLSILIVLFLSCENNVKEEKKAEIISRSVSGGFDTKPFLDVTLKNVDAREIGNDEFNALCSGSYTNHKDGTSIYVNSKKKTISVYIPSCKKNDCNGKSVFFEYEYKVTGAGKNLCYIWPVKPRQIKVNIGEDKISSKDINQFSLIIPVYGFGEGRIEVSPHLKDRTLITDGTFWKD